MSLSWGKAVRRLALVGIILASTVCYLFWTEGTEMTRPSNQPVVPFSSPAQSLTIDNGERGKLAATFWPAKRAGAPMLLLLHGNGGNRNEFVETAPWLNQQGYAVLAIDFAGHGESSPVTKSFGLFEASDARRAFDWLRKRDPRAKVGVIGYSLGGAAALLGDGGPLPADALVIECTYPDIRRAIYNRIAMHSNSVIATLSEPLLSYQSLPRYGVWPSRISPINALAKAKAPVMIIGGGADRHTPPNETHALFDAAHRHGELWILEGLSHDEVASGAPPEIRDRLLTFLKRNLT